MNRLFPALASLVFAASAGAQQPSAPPPQQLEPLVITATRTGQPPEQVAYSVKAIDSEALRANPAIMLDGALRTIPGFSLFRRSDSLSANPTAQGVSLRGLGPSGASRSLVVLDGVPLNDPFGGWVAWTKVPRDGLSRAELVPGGGATAWGNAALGGVVQLLSVPANGATFRGTAIGGDRGTRSAELSSSLPIGPATVQVAARDFTTDGFRLVAPERRGTIDIPASNKHHFVQGRVRLPLGNQIEASVTVRNYREWRNNGTPYQVNGTSERFASASLAQQVSTTFNWSAVAYTQKQHYNQTFSGVNATRTAETPASNQFDVPAKATGVAWTGTLQHAGGARTTAGADWRTVDGETREYFTFVAATQDFSRLRVAGGKQDSGGIFLLHERPLTESLRLVIGGRADTWKDRDGHRRESDRATGVASRDDHYADLDDNEFSPTAGLVWAPDKTWRFRANVQQAYRRPTLNELHRPFRVGANVTEANVALKTEHVTSSEVGFEWNAPAAGPSSRSLYSISTTAFWNNLEDVVGNVTIARGPGTFPIVGTLAAGALGRQRLNLDRARVQGIEISTAWHATDDFTLNAEYLYNDATVRRASVAPALVGNRIAQVPRITASVGAAWRPPGGFTFMPRARFIGRQFEDDENLLILGAVAVIDLAITRPLTPHIELFLNCENITGERIETGRSADGIVNTGTPRLALMGLRGTW